MKWKPDFKGYFGTLYNFELVDKNIDELEEKDSLPNYGGVYLIVRQDVESEEAPTDIFATGETSDFQSHEGLRTILMFLSDQEDPKCFQVWLYREDKPSKRSFSLIEIENHFSVVKKP